MTVRTSRSEGRRLVAAAGVLIVTACVALAAVQGFASAGTVGTDPRALQLPASEPRPSWVDENGIVDEANAPHAAEDYANADGTINCAKAPKTIGIATYDGRLLLDGRGNQLMIPLIVGCNPTDSAELAAAWDIRARQLQEADARTRGILVPEAPQVLQDERVPRGGLPADAFPTTIVEHEGMQP